MHAMYAGIGNAQDGSRATSEPNALEKLFARLKVSPCPVYHALTDQLSDRNASNDQLKSQEFFY